MSETYLIRAKLEFDWEFEKEQDREMLRRPQRLPIKFGPFLLDQSPNFEFHLVDLGLLEPDYKGDSHPNYEYPVSLLYVETKIEVEKGQHPEVAADDLLEQLEAMLRLFQEGDVYVRRHHYMWHLEGDSPRLALFFDFRPTKAEPASLYRRRAYPLDDDTVERFIAFFNRYWDTVHQMPRPLGNAISRFNSSYDRRTLADRLIELMIAMEALFGDNEYHRYKIPLRCACLLYPPGEARKQAFRTIRELYDDRSRIVHGDKLEVDPNYSDERIKQFERHVRISILKFLDLYQEGLHIVSGAQLDDLLFFES